LGIASRARHYQLVSRTQMTVLTFQGHLDNMARQVELAKG
jgi:hypothetical protein